MIPMGFYRTFCRKTPKIHTGIRKKCRNFNTAKKLLDVRNYISFILTT